MFSRTANRRGTAAWRISLWSSIAFAIGTAMAFLFLQHFLVAEIQRRSDAWLKGELEVLAEVANRTPANQFHNKVIREVAELASREIPRDSISEAASPDRAVFFQQTDRSGQLQLHTGAASGTDAMHAIAHSAVNEGHPVDVDIPGFNVPFRVTTATLENGDHVYLALSTAYEHAVLHRLGLEFAALWLTIIALGSIIVYISMGRMLRRVDSITDTAETIGRTSLSSRVPTTSTNDEISRLSLTLNRMLDRIESSMQQLHTVSDALAHDLRSPLTSLRGKLELAISNEGHAEREITIAQSIEQIDRLSSFLTTSLDVSEASAGALRIRKESVDVDEVLRSLVELYEPSFMQAGLTLKTVSAGSARIEADPRLLQRTISNLLDNALKHLPAGCTLTASIRHNTEGIVISFEDDGVGFPEDLLPHVFERYAKRADSPGFGLGLAFVAAVARSHDGTATAANKVGGGARIQVILPYALSPETAAVVTSLSEMATVERR